MCKLYIFGERDTISTNSSWCSVYYLPHGISINIAPNVGIFPEAEGQGKIFTTEGAIRYSYIHHGTRSILEKKTAVSRGRSPRPHSKHGITILYPIADTEYLFFKF